MNKIKDWAISHKDIVLYLIFGGLTTFVNFIIYTIGVKVLSAPITVSNIVAWFVAVIFAYITNKIFVFESKTTNAKELLREIALFLSARITSGLFEIVGVPFLVWIGLNQTIFGIEGMVAKVLVSVIVIVLNYVFSKIFIFKKKGTVAR